MGRGFKHDGSSHRDGIKNEQFVIEHLRLPTSVIRAHLMPDDTYRIEHQGGTKTKIDAVIKGASSMTLSIKNHRTGTFDWTNTTSGVPDINRLLHTLDDIRRSSAETEPARKRVETLFSETLTRWKDNDEWIRGVLGRIYDGYPDGIIITIVNERKLVYFPKSELKDLQPDPSSVYFLDHKEGSTSATIMRRTGRVVFDTHLRVRLVLNNGVTALIGKSASNRSSVPCIKVQQDAVDEWLESVRTVTDPY